MPRKSSSNFQVTELLQSTHLHTVRSNFNDFGNFVYKDHVTRQKYDVNNLKKTSNTHHFDHSQSTASFSHKSNQSLGSMPKIIDDIQHKKWQLSHFLQQLVMMNRIKNKRNYIVSGNEKAQKRRSILPYSLPEISKQSKKQQSIDILKHQVRKQVNQLNTQIFRQYLQKSQPYRYVFGQLNNVSNKGALNTNKIKQIKKKIKQCAQSINESNIQAETIIKNTKLQNKQNQAFDKYFDGVWKELNQQIHFKMKHQSSFNWKHGKKSTLDQIINNYGHQLHLQGNP